MPLALSYARMRAVINRVGAGARWHTGSPHGLWREVCAPNIGHWRQDGGSPARTRGNSDGSGCTCPSRLHPTGLVARAVVLSSTVHWTTQMGPLGWQCPGGVGFGGLAAAEGGEGGAGG